MRFALAALLCLLAFVACELEQPAGRVPIHDSAVASAYQTRASRRLGFDAQGRPSGVALSEVVVTGVDEMKTMPPPDLPTNMLIRTATASIQVESLEVAIAQVKELAAQFGGYVANSGIETGNKQLRNASLEVKIPATRFDDALAGLDPIGKVESVNVSAQDVGEEYVDVDARVQNSRRLERRLIELLGTRTGRLKDVLAVETELARVREDIERAEGRLRYLKAHTATSTIAVAVHERIPVVGNPGRSVMGEAFAQAWRNLVALVAFIVQSLGVILPMGVVAIVAWIVTRRLRVARQRAA